MSVRTDKDMLTDAKTWVGKSYPAGWCQKWTRLRFSAPSTGVDAHAAWRNAKKKVNADKTSVPRYAPTYMVGGNHGHACISLGNGRVISTDAHRNGIVGITTLAALESKWGYKTAGYVRVDGTGNVLYHRRERAKQALSKVTPKKKVKLTVYRIDAGQGDVWRVKSGHTANFRAIPSAKAKIVATKKAGSEFRFVRKVRNGGRLWLQTEAGNWANSNVFEFVRE